MTEDVFFENGLQITFVEAGNRYFGDYHRVVVEARLHLSLAAETSPALQNPSLYTRARQSFGESLVIVKKLERMGVPTADVETVCKAMVDDFLSNSSAYLSRPDYPVSLIKAELNKRRTRRFAPVIHDS